VIKLLSRFNNQNASSSQPNTFIPSSTHGSIPLVAYVIALTPYLRVSSIQILEGRTQLLQPIT